MAWNDNPAGLFTDVPVLNKVAIGSADNPVDSLFVKDLTITGGEVSTGVQTASAFHLTDGSDKNLPLSVYAAGTAYALTASSAALDFGTTDPSLTISKAGTYLLLGRVSLKYNAATFVASRTVTIKLRRTNNTAADVSNSTITLATDIVTTVTAEFVVASLPPIVYTTTNLDDAIALYGNVSVVPSAGSLDAIEASIVAVRLY